MTLTKYSELLAIYHKVGSYSNLGLVDLSYTDICQQWELAVYYNKLHKQLDALDVVRTLQLFNEETGELQSYEILAGNIKTGLQHFAINIGLMHCLSYKQLKLAVDEL